MVVNRSKTGYWNLIAVEYHDDGSGPENIPIIDKPQERVNKNCWKCLNRDRRGGYLAIIVIKKGKYVTVSEGGVKFTITDHPGYYPAAALGDPKVQAKE